jgi:hypothetical protein
MAAMRIWKTSRQAAWWTGRTLFLVILGAARGLHAQNSGTSEEPLLDLFIKKGFVTQEEADQVKAEADFNRTNAQAGAHSDASKWMTGTGDSRVEFFGDVRLRYEDRSAYDAASGRIGLQRERYAVRVGIRGDLPYNFYYGLRLETGVNPRSPWVTFGTSSSATPYQGPFGKSNAGIGIGQAYIGWKPADWINLTVGQMPNPLYTTPMVWSANLNPMGAAERLKYTVGQADFFANFAQFVYQDTNPNEASPGYFGLNSANFYTGNSDSAFLLAFQGGLTYHLTEDISFKTGPDLYYYRGAGADTTQTTTSSSPGFSDVYVGQGARNGSAAAAWSGYPLGAYQGFNSDQTGINNLLVLEVPVEFTFKVGSLTARVFGDYAYNFDGKARAQAAYNAANSPPSSPVNTLPGVQPISSPQIHDVSAYQAGFGIGSTNIVYGPMQGLVYGTSSARNAWEFRTYWQHIEQYSLDPNLIDTDFFEGDENLQGICAAFAYSVSRNIIGTVRYGYAGRINNNLGTGGSGQDIPQMNPMQHYSIFQLDLTVRF